MSEKRTMDISAMLSTVHRAAKVPRPQVEPGVVVSSRPEPTKRVTLTLDAELHRQLKVQAASRGLKVMELTDEAIRQFLAQSE